MDKKIFYIGTINESDYKKIDKSENRCYPILNDTELSDNGKIIITMLYIIDNIMMDMAYEETNDILERIKKHFILR